jgi:DNA modification methylase/ParB-like chromosome segregation protein Spo0J
VDFDPTAIATLADSIEARGLMHPIVVREEASGTWLVAGERRKLAIADLHAFGRTFRCGGQVVPSGMIPTLTLGELSPLEAEEAELEENIRRVDLTWQEEAAATARLADLRTRQAALAGLPAPSVSDIARELNPNLPPSALLPSGAVTGLPHTETRNQLIVAKHLDDPAVAGAANLGDALKILKKREAAARGAALAATVGETYSASSHRLINRNCLEWMEESIAAQFDIILSDPPYGMGAQDFGDAGKGRGSHSGHTYDDSYGTWRAMMNDLPGLLFKLARPQAHAYLFCDLDNFHEFRELMREAGWDVFRTPLIWRNHHYRAPWPTYGPQRQYEAILYAVKGKMPTQRLASDVIEADNPPGQTIHPAQKPVNLLLDLLSRSSLPGMRVLDPFAGSGSTVLACHERKLYCTAIEQDAGHFGQMVERVKKELG